jgi:hypothetical protein
MAAPTTMTFDEVLDAVDGLGVGDQQALLEIVSRRMAERRREELVQDALESRREHEAGLGRSATVAEIMAEILS